VTGSEAETEIAGAAPQAPGLDYFLKKE